MRPFVELLLLDEKITELLEPVWKAFERAVRALQPPRPVLVGQPPDKVVPELLAPPVELVHHRLQVPPQQLFHPLEVPPQPFAERVVAR